MKDKLPYLPKECKIENCENCDYCCDICYDCRYIQCLRFGTLFYTEDDEICENVKEYYAKEEK